MWNATRVLSNHHGSDYPRDYKGSFNMCDRDTLMKDVLAHNVTVYLQGLLTHDAARKHELN